MYSVFTNSNSPDVCEEYGLTNVRTAMKRPFHVAFPDWANQEALPPAPVPVLPQLRSKPAVLVPNWTQGLGEDRAPKRHRIDGAQGSHTFVAGVSDVHTSPALNPMLPPYVPPQRRERPPSVPVLVGATENYSVVGMVDADLVRGAELLGLDRQSGPSFLRNVCKKYSDKFSAAEDRLDAVKKVISILSSIEECIRNEGGRFPVTLQIKLVVGMACFLSKSVGLLKSRFGLSCRDLQKSSFKFFSKNHLVWTLSKENFDSNNRQQVLFVGGKNRFEFLCWCSENNIHLNDEQIEKSFEKLEHSRPKNFAEFFLEYLVDNKEAGVTWEAELRN